MEPDWPDNVIVSGSYYHLDVSVAVDLRAGHDGLAN